MNHPFTPPPTLLAQAKASPSKFRSLTADALRKAGYHGAAQTVQQGKWPVGMWGTICSWASNTDDHHAKFAALCVEARDHLGTLMALEGLQFLWNSEREETIVVDENGWEVEEERVVGS